MNSTITTTPPDNHRDFIGVWVDGNPAGRIRVKGSEFRAFTNRRAPGSALLGTFSTESEAAEAVAAEHKRGR